MQMQMLGQRRQVAIGQLQLKQPLNLSCLWNPLQSELVAYCTFHTAHLESYLAACLFNHIETLDTPLVNYIRRRQGNSPVIQ